MEGPQFSTLAESLLYKESWGADIIGMTNMPEAKLAREAELCYASIAMVTDFDCWDPEHENVEVSDIINTLTSNAALGKNLVKALAKDIKKDREICVGGCDQALEHAIISNPDMIPKEEKERLSIITGRVFKKR